MPTPSSLDRWSYIVHRPVRSLRDRIAVSASTNRSKGDRQPAEWLPPQTGYRCTYLGDWLAVKVRWSLSVDPTERSAIQTLIDGVPTECVPPAQSGAPTERSRLAASYWDSREDGIG